MKGISQNDGSCNKRFSSSGFKHGYLGYAFIKSQGVESLMVPQLGFFFDEGTGMILGDGAEIKYSFLFYIGCTRDIQLYQQKCMNIIQVSGTPNDYGVDTPKSQTTHFSVIFFTHLGLDHLVFAHVILENLKEVRHGPS